MSDIIMCSLCTQVFGKRFILYSKSSMYNIFTRTTVVAECRFRLRSVLLLRLPRV